MILLLFGFLESDDSSFGFTDVQGKEKQSLNASDKPARQPNDKILQGHLLQ